VVAEAPVIGIGSVEDDDDSVAAMNRHWMGCASAVAQTAQSISIAENWRRSRDFWSAVASVASVARRRFGFPWALLRQIQSAVAAALCRRTPKRVAASPRCAVSRVANPPNHLG